MNIFKNKVLLLGGLLLLFSGVFAQNMTWPGDVNNNGIANGVDLIYMGYAYGVQGPQRPNADSLWTSQIIAPWQFFFPSQQLDLAFADTNGDGVVDSLDKNIIESNYRETHLPIFPDSSIIGITGVDPALVINYPANDSIFPGSTLDLEISLGGPNQPVNNFFGISFTISFDTSLVNENNISDVFVSSGWVDSSNTNLVLSLGEVYIENGPIVGEGKFDVCITRTLGTPVTGFGQIGTFSIVMEDNISGKVGNSPVDLNLTLSNVVMLDHNLQSVGVVPVNSTFTVIAANNKQPIIDHKIDLFPNPAKDRLHINTGNLIMNKVELFNLIGQQVHHEIIKNKTEHTCQFNQTENGIFILKIYTNKGILVRKILISSE